MHPFFALLTDPVLERLGQVLLHSLWQGTVLAAVVAVLLRGVTSAPLRYGIAYAGLVAMPVAGIVTAYLLGVASGRPAVSDLMVQATPAALTGSTVSGYSLPLSVSPGSAPSWAIGVTWLWLFGVLVLVLRYVRAWVDLGRLRRRGTVSLPEELLQRFSVLARQMGVGPRCAFLGSVLVTVPLTFGWLRPVILVPVGMLAGLPPAQVEALVAHELAHVRRCDWLTNLVQTVVETLYFFHPAAWWLGRQIRDQREICCDERATVAGAHPHQLAVALARLADLTSGLQVAANGGSLLLRIRRLVTPEVEPGMRWMPVQLALSLVVFLVGLVACGGRGEVARVPVVSFVDRAVQADFSADQPEAAPGDGQGQNRIPAFEVIVFSVKRSRSDLRRLGLGGGMAPQVIGPDALAKIASRGLGTWGRMIMACANGHASTTGMLSQYAYLAGYDVLDESGRIDPTISVLNFGDTVRVQAAVTGGFVFFDALVAQRANLVSVTTCTGNLDGDPQRRQLIWEEPYVIVGKAAAVSGTRLQEGEALAIPFAYEVQRDKAHIRALIRPDSLRETTGASTPGAAGGIDAQEILIVQVKILQADTPAGSGPVDRVPAVPEDSAVPSLP